MKKLKITERGTSLVVQWLRLCTSTAGGTGSIPGLGTKPKKKIAERKKIATELI